jgi:hypothetical protein
MAFCIFEFCTEETKQTPYCPRHLKEELSVEVKTSTIPNAGFGLFATRDFESKVHLVPYEGERFQCQIAGDYALAYKKGHWMDCAWSTTCCAGRYINDPRNSKKVNCRFVYDKIADKVWVVSTKKIKTGEELFLNYGYHAYWVQKRRLEKELKEEKEQEERQKKKIKNS